MNKFEEVRKNLLDIVILAFMSDKEVNDYEELNDYNNDLEKYEGKIKTFISSCEETEKERNELSEKWLIQNLKIEELEMYFKVEKQTLKKSYEDYFKLEKELEELKRDVKRYFELRYEIFGISNLFPAGHKDFNEYMNLGRKLSKVGESI